MNKSTTDLRTTDLGGLPKLLPVPTAAKILGISRASAYRHANAGDLPAKRLGSRIYVITSKLAKFLEEAA